MWLGQEGAGVTGKVTESQGRAWVPFVGSGYGHSHGESGAPGQGREGSGGAGGATGPLLAIVLEPWGGGDLLYVPALVHQCAHTTSPSS